MPSAYALGIVSGNSILDFGAAERLRAFRCSFFHRQGRDGKRQVQRRFLRKRGAADIPGNRHTKQKSHRFCISASTMASCWSGRRGSNSLPPPWQGGALPDELRPHIRCIFPCTLPFFLTGSPRKLAKQDFVGKRRKSGIHHRSLACKTSR